MTPQEIQKDLDIIAAAVLSIDEAIRVEDFGVSIAEREIIFCQEARNRWPLYIEGYQYLKSSRQSLSEELDHTKQRLTFEKMRVKMLQDEIEELQKECVKRREFMIGQSTIIEPLLKENALLVKIAEFVEPVADEIGCTQTYFNVDEAIKEWRRMQKLEQQ